MELRDAINERHSIRGYKDIPVSKKLICEILELATRAISAVNSQPWEFIVVTGKELDEIKAYNMNALHSNFPEDREDTNVPKGVYQDRRRTIGKALLGAMNIKRENKEERIWWRERGYRFFDAPAVIFLLMDESLDETAYRFDMGCVAQNVTLVAVEKGLGTCVSDQAITYQKGLREILGIPEEKRFVVGICIGYPDKDFAANQVISEREPIENITVWHGFAN